MLYLYICVLLNLKSNKFIILFIFNIIIMLIYYFIHDFNIYKNNIVLLNIFLSLIFSLEEIIQKEYDNGNLDILYLIKIPLEFIIFHKILMHYFMYFITQILFFILISIMGLIDDKTLSVYHLFHGTLYLNSLGFLGTTLLLGSKTRIFLLNIILFPLFLPYFFLKDDFILIHLLNILSYFMLFIIPMLITHFLKKL